MELQREMESKHSAGTWASVGGSGTAPKPATDEFERAFRLGRKERNGSRLPPHLTLSGAPIWCSGEMQVSMQSHLATYSTLNLVLVGAGQAVQSLSQGWESWNYTSSDSTVAHSHP